MNLANKITMFRVILIPVFLIFLLAGVCPPQVARIVAVIIFIVASLTDMLDGYIARSRNLVTNLGKFLDPLADKLLVCAALVSMVYLGYLAPVAVIIIISREFIITGFRLIAVEGGQVIAASWWGKVKTAVQMVMIIIVLLWPQSIIGFWLQWAAVVLTVISGVDYLVKNKAVLKG